MEFAVFEKFTSAYYTKLQEKSCYYLLIIFMKKHYWESRQWKFWKHMQAICNLHSCYNFMLLKNALVFSQSDRSTWFFSCTLLLPLFITMLANSRNLYIAVQFIFAVFFYLAVLTFCSFLRGRLCVLHNKRESEYSSLTYLHTRSCCCLLCCQVEGNQVVC